MLKPAIVTLKHDQQIKNINRAVKCKTYMRDHLKKNKDDLKDSLYFYGLNEENKLVKVFLY